MKTTRKKNLVYAIGTLLLGGFISSMLYIIPAVQGAWSWGTWLDDSFWESNPSTGNIIYALYGNGTTGSTVYTKNRVSSCIPTTVQYLDTSFTGGNLSANTIYVLDGEYTLTGGIVMESCSAIVGKNETILHKGGSIHDIYASNKSNIIIDNLELDGNGNGLLNDGIKFSTTTSSTINNVKTYENRYGIIFQSSSNYNTINNVQSYNNTGSSYGLYIASSNYNTIEDAQFHNNAYGIKLEIATNNKFNNIIISNNDIGIDLPTLQFLSILPSYENTFNNTQINNNSTGMLLGCLSGSLKGNVINNSIIYNNVYGLYTTGCVGIPYSSHIINQSKIYNNGIGVYAETNKNNFKIYGSLTFFNNTSNTGGSNNITLSTTSLSAVGRSAGSIVTNGGTMSYYEMTNAKNTNNDKLLNGTTWATLVGTQTRDASLQPIKYIFGKNILKQTRPVEYIGSTLSLSTKQTYTTTKFIAEPENTLNDAEQAIAEYYFGTTSEFTSNRNENNCTMGAFTIAYPSSLPTTLNDHTIYILTEGEYATTGTIVDGNCIAVVGSGDVNITPDTIDSEAIFLATGKQNLIFDNLRINGNKDSPTTQHGIKLDDDTTDSTINNVKSFNNVQNGITLGIGSEYITIMNSQTFNNNVHGIEIYYIGNYNFINNSLSFNNKYGVRFGNGSIKNTINNAQFYNNEVGIFADLTTQENIINNVLAYNNSEEGIRIKQSSGNLLNKVQAYNNTIGISISDSNSINNKYFNSVHVYNNTGCGSSTGCNFSGTNGSDAFLSPGIRTNRIPATWVAGSLYNETLTASCNTVTNIKYTSLGTEHWLLDFLTQESNCLLTGQNTWNPYFPSGSSYSDSFDFLFGNTVTKQIQPVGYSGAGITEKVVLLDAQYDASKYIGEINTIRWTNPSNVIIENPCSLLTGCAINTEYVTTGTIERGMVNANVWAILSTTGSLQSASLEINDGGNRVNVGTSAYDLPFGTTQARIRFTTVGTYNTGFTLSLNVGDVGNNTTGSSNPIRSYTQQDPTPPTLTITDDVGTGGIWTGKDIVSATGSAMYGHTLTGIRYMLTGSTDCTTAMFSGGTLGTAYTTGITITNTGDNGKYICFWTRDNENLQEVTVRSNQIQISELGFNQAISATTGYYQVIDINFQNLYNYGYAFVTSGIYCTGGVHNNYIDGTNISLTGYTVPTVINSTTIYNGKYLCAYGEDVVGSGKFILSANPINVQDYSTYVHFTDNVEAGPVQSENIGMYFAPSITTKLYTYVTNASDCTSVYTGTAGVTPYPTSGTITISSEGYNNKYFCIYTVDTSGFVYRTISNNKVNVDITTPTTPTILYPLLNQDVRFLTLEWTGSTENNTAGISGYNYLISDEANFENIIFDEMAYGTGTKIFPTIMNTTDPDVYYWKVRAVDYAGNVSDRSSVGVFNYLENNITFNEVTQADKGTIYRSNEVTISGLRVGEIVTASIDQGGLFKNGNLRGTGTTVQNGDRLYIEVMSSNEDDEIVTSTLTITNRIIEFNVTTKGEALDEDQMLRIISIFNGIIETYGGDTERLYEYLYTFRSMLEDEIDLEEDANERAGLEYLLDLVNNYLENEMQDGGLHTAPNCKEYEIVYDEDEESYYSPTMRKRTDFASREALVRVIDVNNPGDCFTPRYGVLDTDYENTDTTKHIAPNGKIYTIERSDLGYTSPNFLKVKYFLSISELRGYININNPAVNVWEHEVDTDFDPIEHTAPNGKTYKIYKTDRGYMSYKLLKVKYYTSLDELTAYIDKNNK